MGIATMMRSFGLTPDPGAWIVPGRLLLRSRPRRSAAFRDLAAQDITVLVNLDRRPHDPTRLARFGLEEVHVPVKDFFAPAPAQIERGVTAIDTYLAGGQNVVVHCGGGLGRSGTLVACYLVYRGTDVREAIARVRLLRPGAIETARQAAAVESYAQQRKTLTP
jgi:atypical dual specificity phosphatase